MPFFYSKNHGADWIDRPDDSPIDIHTLLAHPKASNRLYAACGDGINKKKDILMQKVKMEDRAGNI